ncbi:MAG: cupin domain-containing protein [Acidimicrobiales bacterium]
MSVLEETLLPRAFVTPHVHQNDVWVYVVSGEIGVLVGDEISMAHEREWALKPRNVQHAV